MPAHHFLYEGCNSRFPPSPTILDASGPIPADPIHISSDSSNSCHRITVKTEPEPTPVRMAVPTPTPIAQTVRPIQSSQKKPTSVKPRMSLMERQFLANTSTASRQTSSGFHSSCRCTTCSTRYDSRFPPTHLHAGDPTPRSLPFFDFMVATSAPAQEKSRFVKNIVHEAVKLKDNVLIFVHSIPTLSSKVPPVSNSRFPPRPSCQHTSSSKSRIVKNIVHEAVKLKDNSRFPPSPSCQHTDSRFPPRIGSGLETREGTVRSYQRKRLVCIDALHGLLVD